MRPSMHRIEKGSFPIVTVCINDSPTGVSFPYSISPFIAGRYYNLYDLPAGASRIFIREVAPVPGAFLGELKRTTTCRLVNGSYILSFLQDQETWTCVQVNNCTQLCMAVICMFKMCDCWLLFLSLSHSLTHLLSLSLSLCLCI